MTDPIIRISLCDHRIDRRYRNVEKPWNWLRERNRHPIRTMETAEKYAISTIMGRMKGWKRDKTYIRFPLYGQQRIYVRDETPAAE